MGAKTRGWTEIWTHLGEKKNWQVLDGFFVLIRGFADPLHVLTGWHGFSTYPRPCRFWFGLNTGKQNKPRDMKPVEPQPPNCETDRDYVKGPIRLGRVHRRLRRITQLQSNRAPLRPLAKHLASMTVQQRPPPARLHRNFQVSHDKTSRRPHGFL